MTSLSIISGVVARIKYLMGETNKQPAKSWSDDAQLLLSGLEGISKSLKAADQEPKQSEQFVNLKKQILQLSYNIEDVIEAKELGIQSKSKGKLSGQCGRPSGRSSEADVEGSLFRAGLEHLKNLKLSRQSTRPSGTSSEPDLESFKDQLKLLEDKLKITPPGPEILPKLEKNTSPAQTSHQADPRAATGEDLPRMEDEVTKALSRQDLSVVSICGRSGMGKTTLAKKVFKHREVRGSFQVFAWVPIEQECQTKKVLQDILLQLLPNKKTDIGGMSEVQLTLEILTFQKEKRCLFVLEDIGTVQDWQNIRVALLLGNSSKILITTPSKDVAEMATSGKAVFSMKTLTDAECFKILKEKASFDDHELETVGKVICSLSQGSPLLAVILGRSLKAVDVPARDQLVLELDKYRSQNPEGEKSQNPEGEKQVFGLCYHILSDELKPCLLYMGQFPEGQDIEVEKLHLLLKAEGLISPEDSGKNEILKNLAHKKLVQVQENKVSMTRTYKSCKLHDRVRKFCIFKGQAEWFFDIVDFESGKQSKKLEISTLRLAIYLSKYKDGDVIPFSSQDMVKKIRSLLIFDTYESSEAKSAWPSEINDLKEFSRLRVLDFDGVNFRVRKVPRGIDKIDFLRYLSFRGCWLETFASSVSKFPSLETLDLRVRTDCTMTIPNNVLSNMKRLRHLYFPVLYKSDDNSKLQLSGLDKLEILVNFDTGACDVNDLSRLKNLLILTAISEGNHQDLEAVVKFLDEKAANILQSSFIISDFDCYAGDRVTIFKKLLECKSLHSLDIEGQIGRLPKDVAISPNLTEMLFDGSEIKDDPVNVLGNLPNLRSLVLSNEAFVVKEIFFPDASKFPELRILKLQKLQYLEKLEFRKGAVPMLSTLVIEKCCYLEKVSIPEELHNRLQLAQGKKGDDVYSVQPLLNITGDTDQV